MPLDSTAERVQEPPQEEASEATLKKAPEGRPELRVVAPPEEADFEVSPAAQETFSDQTKETVAGLQPESKGFVGKLYERIKSSEVVQNVVDRYQVWRNEGMAARAQSKIEKLGASQQEAHAEAVKFDASAARVHADFQKLHATLQEMGTDISTEVRDKVKAEHDAYLARADEGYDKAQTAEGRIQDVRTEQEQYKSKVEEARGHLDGRLAAKQEINGQLAQEYNQERDALNAGLESDQQYFKELDGHAKKLRALLKEDVSKQLRPTIEKNLKDIESRQAGLLAEIKKMEAARAKVESKVKGLQDKNADLQAKRDKIFPSREKPAEAGKSAEQPIAFKVAGGEMSLDYGSGGRAYLYGDKIEVFNGNGDVETFSSDDAPDDILEQFVARMGDKESPQVTLSDEMRKRVEATVIRQPEKEEQPKFLAGDIVAAWNQEVGKGSGLQVTLEKSADPKKDLGSEVVAKDMLLTLLAKRLNRGDVKTLSGSTKGKVENFLAKRSAARR